MTPSTDAMRLVTLPVNGAWQPVNSAGSQHEGQTAEFWAYSCAFVVDSDWTEVLASTPDPVVTHEGFETREKAGRFARSMGGPSRVSVREVEPYWYVRNFGRVEGVS